MTDISDQITSSIFDAICRAYPEIKIDREDITLEHPNSEDHGDYATNIGLKLAKDLGKKGTEIAQRISAEFKKNEKTPKLVSRVEVADPGFINFWLSKEWLAEEISKITTANTNFGKNIRYTGKKVMVEYAHPNTHKELHIGHMRTLTTGEALARIFEFSGANIFRANYQGDIGPHVAKAIWGTGEILTEQKKSWEQAEKLSLKEKAHLLGQGYIRGNNNYEEFKQEIDGLNSKLYHKDTQVWPVYERTRRWSLEYYDDFYRRFYTKFDRLYFESEVSGVGKRIVEENVGKVFLKSEGALIFEGEKYGLHRRVFVTSDGNPTYEGKEMALGQLQFADFPFDLNVHVVANEQAGYFQVVFKALELLDKKFSGREHHLSMGMVQLVGKKISSRTGEIVTVDGLLDQVKDLLRPLVHGDIEQKDKEEILEAATIGAVKYSVLKTSPLLNSTFDLEKSVSLDGDSGPYLQYTYARARSVLRKAQVENLNSNFEFQISNLKNEELAILHYLYRFPEVVEQAAKNYSPNLICSYLFELAQRFNNFYNNVPILKSESTAFRLSLVEATSIVLKNGLNLLGITPLERM